MTTTAAYLEVHDIDRTGESHRDALYRVIYERDELRAAMREISRVLHTAPRRADIIQAINDLLYEIDSLEQELT